MIQMRRSTSDPRTSDSGTMTTICVSANGVKVDDQTGNFYCAGGSSVHEIASDLSSVIKTWGPFTGYSFTSVDEYASKQVTGVGSAIAGQSYQVDFAFPGLGLSAYQAALSLTQRPGIPIGSETINLTFDALFLLSIQGQFVSGFCGQLDAQGRASGKIGLPGFLPTGTRIYCSCVAVGGLGLTLGNTIGIFVD